MEWIRRIAATLAGTKYGDFAWLLLHLDQCDMFGDIYARLGRTGTARFLALSSYGISLGMLRQPLGCTVAIL